MTSLFTSRKCVLLMLSVVTTLALTDGWAERIYKWKDADGQTVYSQTPPPEGIRAERLSGAPRSPEDPVEAMNQLRERAEAFAGRREDRLLVEKEGQQALEEKKKRDEICATLRKNLETLQNNPRVRDQSEGKEPVVITEEQRQANIKSTQERIQKECTNN
ncbi:MAG: DUF4124 domain-containing protein [Gammaproteobacteria bacterium]|nr:DUF4124 domain-containing protein [Gammaproteobacteria bacterium]